MTNTVETNSMALHPGRDQDVANPASSPAQDRLVIGAAIGLTVGPIALDLGVSGPSRAFAYLSADSFYYLVVGRNWALHNQISFDGTHATNGFHPLWQIVVAMVVRAASWLGLSSVQILPCIVVVCLLAVGSAVWLFGRTLRSAYGYVHPLFLLIPVGGYALLFAPIWVVAGGLSPSGADPREGPLPLYGTLWSDVNGMESALALLAYAALAALIVRTSPDRLRVVPFGLLLTAVVLARLDLAAVSIAIAIVFLLAGIREHKPSFVRKVMLAGSVGLIILGIYLIWNRWYSGMILPVSGSLKTTFPHPTTQNLATLLHLLPSLVTQHNSAHVDELFRLGAIVIPSVASIAYLCWWALKSWGSFTIDAAKDRYRLMLVGSCVGVLILSVYDTLFVPLFDQGSWYWPVSTFLVSLLLLEWIQEAKWSSMLGRRPLLLPILVVAALCDLSMFFVFEHRPGYHDRYAEFATVTAPKVRSFYSGRLPDFLEADDGIGAYFLRAPSLSATGLSADAQAADAIHDHDLLALSVCRGYNRIDSLVYQAAQPGSTSAAMATALSFVFPDEDLYNYHFTLEYFDPLTHFTIIRVEPDIGGIPAGGHAIGNQACRATTHHNVLSSPNRVTAPR